MLILNDNFVFFTRLDSKREWIFIETIYFQKHADSMIFFHLLCDHANCISHFMVILLREVSIEIVYLIENAYDDRSCDDIPSNFFWHLQCCLRITNDDIPSKLCICFKINFSSNTVDRIVHKNGNQKGDLIDNSTILKILPAFSWVERYGTHRRADCTLVGGSIDEQFFDHFAFGIVIAILTTFLACTFLRWCLA